MVFTLANGRLALHVPTPPPTLCRNSVQLFDRFVVEAQIIFTAEQVLEVQALGATVCSILAFADARASLEVGACTVATYSTSNLSGFRLVGGDEYSNSTTRDGCLAACCGRANCSAWNYHLSSADPAHNVRSCWLSTEAEPLLTPVRQDPGEPENADVWVGGSKRPTRTRDQPQHPRFADIPQCDGSDYDACRKSLWKYVFNTTTGELPSKAKPDFLVDMPDWEMKGFPGPGQGTGVRMHVVDCSPHGDLAATR